MQRLREGQCDSLKSLVGITFDIELIPIIREEFGAHRGNLGDRGYGVHSQCRAQNEGVQSFGIHGVRWESGTQYSTSELLSSIAKN